MQFNSLYGRTLTDPEVGDEVSPDMIVLNTMKISEPSWLEWKKWQQKLICIYGLWLMEALFTCGEMDVAEILDNFLTLGAFAGTGSSQDEDNVGFGHFERLEPGREEAEDRRPTDDERLKPGESNFCQHQRKLAAVMCICVIPAA